MAPLNKSDLRTRFLSLRQAIPAGDAARAAQELKENFLSHIPLEGVRAAALYYPTRGEIDVLPLMAVMADRGIITALPVVAKSHSPHAGESKLAAQVSVGGNEQRFLAFRHWKPGDPLIPGALGIMEPPASAAEIIPDLLIVPLVAFDSECHRLGYGGGYYDATIARLRAQNKKLLAVGVGYDLQQADPLPREEHDARLDAAVTEKNIVIPAKAGI